MKKTKQITCESEELEGLEEGNEFLEQGKKGGNAVILFHWETNSKIKEK